MTKMPTLKPIAAAVTAAMLFASGFSSQAQERVFGADISYWNCGTSSTGISQGNWNTAYTNGNVRFVWLRATRGGTTGLDQSQGTPGGGSTSTLSRRYDDPRFTQNLDRATGAGILTGSYHFGRADITEATSGTGGIANTGTDEANHFIEMAGAWMRPGYLLPIFDLEAGQSQRSADALAQFCVDFSDRIYAVMQIRPGMYINGTYSGTMQNASQSIRESLAKPEAYTPSVTAPAYSLLWDARYADNGNPGAIPIQTGSPKFTYSTVSSFYGPWDDYGNDAPWSFWQYASTVSIPGFNAVDSTCDANICHGDYEYLLNYLVPAVWWHDSDGNWNTLANWNSGQAPIAPVTPLGQATPYATATLPTPREPGASGIVGGPISTRFDTVILDRPNADITVTHSSGAHNIRKLFLRETLNITGGTLMVTYDPTYRADDSADVLHGGPISAQVSGALTLSGGTFMVYTLQVDPGCAFTLSGGAVTFDQLNLMPNGSSPGKLAFGGNVIINPFTNMRATVSNGSGAGNSGFVDLGGATRSITVGNSGADIDLSIEVPITNGGLTKAGPGTMRVNAANSYNGGTTVSAGRLLVNGSSGSGTGTGSVTVSGGILSGNGMIAGTVNLNSGGTIAPGTTGNMGTLTLNSAPVLNGTHYMRIDRNGGSSLSDKVVVTTGTLSYGGTLTVTNDGATLTGGEVFTLFSANSYTGAFTVTNLPDLSSDLNWCLDKLTVNGTIRVNRKPLANLVSFTNEAPQVLQIPIASLVSNATDPDSDPLSVSAINLATTNGITLLTNSTFIYYSNFLSVADQFTYTVSDGCGGIATGIVNIVPSVTGRVVSAPTLGGNSLTLHFAGRPGWTYYIDRSTNLPVWMTISTNVAPSNSLFNFVDTFSDLGVAPPSAYYRLRWPSE